jgi:hypothetical protein
VSFADWLLRRPPPYASGNPNRNGRDLPTLTAAGFRIQHTDTDQLRRLIQPWQARAFSYYDQLGEIKYASQFYSRMLAPLRLFPAKLDPTGDWVEIEREGASGDDLTAFAMLDRVQDPGGGREALLSSYGRLMFLAGECYLLVTKDPDTGDEQWEMLSTDELRIQSGIYTRYKAPSLAAANLHEAPDDEFEPLDKNTAVAYRLWQKHPRYSMLADSTMMGVLDLCEELLLLTRAVRSRARSRLAGSGLLAISEDFSHSPLEATADEDPDVDPFLADLRDAMTAPIANEGAASAVVPIVVRGPTEAIEKGIRHIQIIDPTQLYPETGLRTECIHRIALGLDMPPEVLEGLSDANHWTAWQIDDQTWTAHGMPKANQLVNDLTQAYYRPTLRAEGIEGYTTYAIGYDPSAVVNQPNKLKDALELFDRIIVGHEYVREAGGISEEAAPTEDQRAEMIGIKVRDPSLAWFGIPSVKAGGVETAPGEVVSAETSAPPPPAGPPTGGETEKGPPPVPAGEEEQLAAAGSGRNGNSALAFARIAGAADLAILRIREAAGNRIRSLAKRDPEVLALIEGVRASDVAATLGPERVRALRVSERELVAAAKAVFEETLRMWGVSDDAKAKVVLEQIELHAARTLYDLYPSPLPPAFQRYVAGVFEKAA